MSKIKIITICAAVFIVISFMAGQTKADLRDGLVAYYPFNGNAYDKSGNGNNGTILGGATFSEDHYGNPNGALSCDGIDDYVALPNESSFDLTEFSIVMWIKVPDYSKENWLISKGFYFGNYTITINEVSHPWPGYAGYVHQTASGNWSTFIDLSGPVPLNEYFQVAVTVGPAGFKGYINGNLKRQVISTTSPKLNDDPVTIGAGGYDSISDFFLGDIDDVRIYNRVLSDSEVTELYLMPAPMTLSGWVFMIPDAPDFGYSLDEDDLVYFYSSEPVLTYNMATGLRVEGPLGWTYFYWPFLYELDTDILMFALPPESGLWVYHFSTGEWEVLPRIIPW